MFIIIVRADELVFLEPYAPNLKVSLDEENKILIHGGEGEEDITSLMLEICSRLNRPLIRDLNIQLPQRLGKFTILLINNNKLKHKVSFNHDEFYKI